MHRLLALHAHVEGQARASVQSSARGGLVTLNLDSSMVCMASFWDSMAVPSMPSSPYRNWITLSPLLRTVPSYLHPRDYTDQMIKHPSQQASRLPAQKQGRHTAMLAAKIACMINMDSKQAGM